MLKGFQGNKDIVEDKATLCKSLLVFHYNIWQNFFNLFASTLENTLYKTLHRLIHEQIQDFLFLT